MAEDKVVYEVWDDITGKMLFACETEEGANAWITRQVNPGRYTVWESDEEEDDDAIFDDLYDDEEDEEDLEEEDLEDEEE